MISNQLLIAVVAAVVAFGTAEAGSRSEGPDNRKRDVKCSPQSPKDKVECQGNRSFRQKDVGLRKDCEKYGFKTIRDVSCAGKKGDGPKKDNGPKCDGPKKDNGPECSGRSNREL